MPAFPALACYQLSQHQQTLVEHWISPYGDLIADGSNDPAWLAQAANSRPIVMRNARKQDVQDLLKWFVPVCLIVGDQDREVISSFLDLGVCAIVHPTTEEVMIRPPMRLPQISGICFVVSDNPLFRTRMRQILPFCGREARMDFHSAEELAEVLSSSAVWPELIILDLDSKQVDAVAFFSKLEKVLRDRPLLRAKNKMIICKDFEQPGLDPIQMKPVLAPHAKRIFHPNEAILALIEGLIFHSENAVRGGFQANVNASSRFITPRNLNDILYEDFGTSPGRSPRSEFDWIAQESERLGRSLPFLDLTESLKKTQTASLSYKQ